MLDKKFSDLFLNVSSRAALSSYYLVGKKDKIAADKAAVDSMRSRLNEINMSGRIVIGEGELDEAPMLYIGEKLGSKNGPELDIAVDPLEGTNFAAHNLPGALSVIAVAEKNKLFGAPETYMDKISSNVSETGVVDLDFSVKKNIYNLADYKNKKPEDLSVCILDRPRHKSILNELNNLKVKVKLISDGDVSGALLVTDKKYGVDLFLGIGGGPEGVLAASALDAFNCNFQGRFLFETDKDKSRAFKMGIKDLKKKYELKEIVTGDSIFCATGVTNGDLTSGIEISNNEFTSETLITHKSLGLKKIIKKKQKI
jgi:fructose-1,6-bisphosphatase II / sedoheptulose-1,7-bisphosphatase